MQLSRLKKYSKIIICLGSMILLSVGTATFAQSTTPNDSWNLSQGIQQIITLFSRLWVVLAMGAGKLMSNTFVYGEFMNFDVYLWQMWNISKNFANMGIGFFFLFYVRKLVFTPDQLTGSEVGKKIGGFLLAGVLIQASWFMMGALLDIEKITTSAMGALPGLVIQDDNTWGQNMVGAMSRAGVLEQTLELKKSGTNPTYLVHDPKQNVAGINPGSESVLDAILPSHNSLAGPLYFIGFSIFQFQEYSKVPVDPSLTLEDLSWMFTATGIKFLVLAAFVIMMLLLFIINIIRIAYLWMIIALAPLIVLYLVLKEVLGMELGDSSNGIISKINVPTILAYVFQPTIIITFMGLILIAVTALWQGMDGSATTVISEYGFTISTGGVEHATFELETKGDLFSKIGDSSKGIFKNLIILGLVFALLLGLIVLSASSMKVEFIANIAKSLGKTLVQIPFIPVYSAGGAANRIIADTTGINIAQNYGKIDMKGENALKELMGLPTTSSPEYSRWISKLKSNMSNPTDYFNELRSWSSNQGDKGLAIAGVNAPDGITNSLVSFLNTNNAILHNNYGFTKLELDEQGKPKILNSSNLKEYLAKDGNKNAKALYRNIMGLGPTANVPSDITGENIMSGRIKFGATKASEIKKTSTTTPTSP